MEFVFTDLAGVWLIFVIASAFMLRDLIEEYMANTDFDRKGLMASLFVVCTVSFGMLVGSIIYSVALALA